MVLLLVFQRLFSYPAQDWREFFHLYTGSIWLEMNTYAIWVDLASGVGDLEFSRALNSYLGFLKDQSLIESHRLQRRKLGFGPSELGEWFIQIETKDLAQLDEAFNHAAARDGEYETLHAEVFRRVKNFRSGLYRDFPDPVRTGPNA